MSKKSLILLVVAAFVMSLGVGVSMSFADGSGPETITLNDAGKKPAQFPHWKHQEKNECATCHHSQGADGKQGPYVAGEEKVCDECHNAEFANEKLSKWKDIGHGLCKACHTEKKAEGAPTKCTACHVKE